MFKFYQKLIKQQSKGLSRIPSLAWLNGVASSTAAEVNNVNTQSISDDKKSQPKTSRNHKLIDAAFASIHLEDHSWEIKTPVTDNKIKSAKSINELLSISDGSGVSRNHALKTLWKYIPKTTGPPYAKEDLEHAVSDIRNRTTTNRAAAEY